MPDTNKNQQMAKYIAIVVVSVAVGAAGAGISFWFGQQSGLKKVAGEAAQLVAVTSPSHSVDNNSAASINDGRVLTIFGKIKSIDGDVISLENIGFVNTAVVYDGSEKEIRKVTVDSGTELSTTDGKKIGLTDLKVGDIVNASAKVDIKTKQEFTATTVELFVISASDVPVSAPAAKSGE